MELAAIERTLSSSKTGAIVVDARIIRRVIKVHRQLAGLGLHIPHAHVYALARDALFSLLDPGELGVDPKSLPGDVVLVSRPSYADVAGKSRAEILQRFWR